MDWIESRVKKLHKDACKKGKALQKNRNEATQGMDTNVAADGRVDAQALEHLRRSLLALDALIPQMTKHATLAFEEHACMHAIGVIDLDRVSDLLIDCAKKYQHDLLPPYLVDALLANPTLDRIRITLSDFELLQEKLKDVVKAMSKAHKQKMPRTPKGYTGGTRAWNNAFERAKENRKKRLLTKRETIFQALVTAQNRRSEFAKGLGMEPPKVKKDRYEQAWNNWLHKNEKLLRKNLEQPAVPATD